MKKLVIVILLSFCTIACGKKNQEIKNDNKKNLFKILNQELKQWKMKLRKW